MKSLFWSQWSTSNSSILPSSLILSTTLFHRAQTSKNNYWKRIKKNKLKTISKNHFGHIEFILHLWKTDFKWRHSYTPPCLIWHRTHMMLMGKESPARKDTWSISFESFIQFLNIIITTVASSRERKTERELFKKYVLHIETLS